ncbi:cache domain-containing protein [Dongia deserti]|uniref:cache domain-containing protein n=1 Tax=Dongia deserti TaxID=2268030 RepID=UPI0025474E35|nr:cache domain-containing protein [Dongia deserti]
MPIFGVALVIAAILGIALYSHHANKQDVLALSTQLLDTLDRQISQRVMGYLDSCTRSLQVLGGLILRLPETERRAVAEGFAAGALQQIPQISAFLMADSEGNFSMVSRGKQVNWTAVKQISNVPDRRQVLWIDRDREGDEMSRREDPTDEFDPRTRPWYRGALEASGVFWTGVYVFFTEKKPGVTISERLVTPDGKDYVLGADISLERLSTFLGSLEIGRSGRAVLIDGEGHLIAAPDAKKTVKQVGEEFVPPRVDEIDDPILTAAYDRFRVQGAGRRMVEFNGESYVTSATPLPGEARDWWVLMVVPEADFTGFVATNHQRTLMMSLVIVVAVAVMAFLLFRQGLRYDHSVHRMAEQSRTISRQSSAYAAIAEQSEQFISEEGRLPPILTEALTELASARRASIWRLTSGDRVLHCDDSFDSETQSHASGFQLHRREMPRFFEFLKEGEEAEITDAARDHRTAQFYRQLMEVVGTHALFVLPLHRGERTTGVLCLEDAQSLEGLRTFVHTVASMTALQLRSLEEPDHERRPKVTRSQTEKEQTPSRILPADLRIPGLDTGSLGAKLYTGIAIMALRFSGPVALAKKAHDNGSDLADAVAQALQQEADEVGVDYLKFVSQQAIAAAGLNDEDAGQAMAKVAALAVALRDRCATLFESAEGAEFRIGLHFGHAFGCGIGDEPRQFNLWGEAVETADTMAASAAAGAIQVSEAAYPRLRQDFLLRPRGSFYMPGVGEGRTFVLAGQL